MVTVLIAVDDGDRSLGKAGSEIDPRLMALQKAIAADPVTSTGDTVTCLAASQVGHAWPGMDPSDPDATVLCPLTLDIAADLEFPGQSIYARCRDVAGLRRWVADTWGYSTGTGTIQVPIVWTARGPLYAEAIAPVHEIDIHGSNRSGMPYLQPLHLSDRQRQSLYRLGGNLLRSLSAPPAVYMLQVAILADDLLFDRLWPFPTEAAIASVGCQTPDLLTAHWRSLTQRSVLDVAIATPVTYGVLKATSV
ncbi:MAG: hypothetical protein EA367_09685 [Leptolyngbya sp. DLM2.Bin15]|nr:MAG: hypothetical protein EA367_09685 [Leptolyngbya sp. DLM2.Bin15]